MVVMYQFQFPAFADRTVVLKDNAPPSSETPSERVSSTGHHVGSLLSNGSERKKKLPCI